MKRKLRTSIVGMLVALTLMLGTTEANAFPTNQGALLGSYMFCAPGSHCALPDAWRGKPVNCLSNQDYFNGNIGLGFGTGGYSYNTYQGILLRHWVYCGSGLAAKPHSVVVGNGYCLTWVKFVPKFVIGSGGIIQYFGSEVARGAVQGSALSGNIFRLSTANSVSYSLNAYPC